MPFDADGNFVLPTRDEIIARYERDYRLRNPNAKTGPNTLVSIDAATMADTLIPAYADAKKLADSADLEKMTQAQLDQECGRLRIPTQLPARGASGFVAIVASAGGTTIFKDDELVDKTTKLRYRCTRTDTYKNGASVPIVGKDTGPATNAPAGRKLTWSSPRPGCGPTGTVVEQSDGSGLKGGRAQESPAEQIDRIRRARNSPAVAGNTADFERKVEETPDVAVGKAFIYSAPRGPGSIAFAFTLRPTLAENGAQTGSRIPSAGDIQLVKGNIAGPMPEDDSIIGLALVQQPVTLVLEVEWAEDANGWADIDPWPLFHASQPVLVQSVVSPVKFTLASGGGITTNPQVGQTIAFFDPSTATWKRKRISAVSGTDPWIIDVDQTNDASDVSFAPEVGDRVSPWSESLDLVTPAALESFGKLGPGELLDPTPDLGQRIRRIPRSPAQYPSVLSTRVLQPVYDLAALDQIDVKLPSLPNSTTVGLLGSYAYLQELVAFAVHPKQ